MSSRFDLVAFDVDGTLVHGPDGWTVWEVLNQRFTGRSDHNVERYAMYRCGKLSYAEWVALDIEGWRAAGARRRDLIAAFSTLTAVPGTLETLARLKRDGCRLAVISGTLDLMLHTLLPDAPFDDVFANHIGFDRDGKITHWQATSFDMQGKAKALRAVAAREGFSLERCAYVGDSENDLWVAREAGFCVAFNPKSEELERIADVTVRGSNLNVILPHLAG